MRVWKGPALIDLTIQRELKMPIREQIVCQIAWQVATGHIVSGTVLPSIRALYNTCLQAYRKLAKLGIIQLRQGSGARVAPLTETGKNIERLTQWASLSTFQPLECLARDFVFCVFMAGYQWQLALQALEQAQSPLLRNLSDGKPLSPES